MHVARVDDELVRANPDARRGTCPGCGRPTIAKCGRVMPWHWAHQAGADCDPWSERDTAWHRAWQAHFPVERTEVVMGPHRADAVTATGDVIEFQHSPLSVDDIREREAFYGPSMIWVFDVTAAYERERFLPRYRRPGCWTFRWKQARKSIRACRRDVALDLGDGRMFDLGRIYADEAPVGGWGRMIEKVDFLDVVAGGARRGHDDREMARQVSAPLRA